MGKVNIVSFSGLKLKQGFTSKFWELDRELKNLDHELTHEIIASMAGNSNTKKVEIQTKIGRKDERNSINIS